MQIIESVKDMQSTARGLVRAGETIAFVGTMGDLHAGHLSLVERAKTLADKVIVSILVNPLQFNDRADYLKYKQPFAEDAALLQERGVDLLFHPPIQAIFPNEQPLFYLSVHNDLFTTLEGASRPGHFQGMVAIVCRLLNIVQPDVAIFGEKDYQQLYIIRQLVADLGFPVEIVAAPTVREPDGLAMSSRNARLSPNERRDCALIYQTLDLIRVRILRGDKNYARLSEQAMIALQAFGLEPDYFCVRRAEDLAAPAAHDQDLILLTAVRVGETRLIDNLKIYQKET
jgi:pantoate--beta-alanine ligase